MYKETAEKYDRIFQFNSKVIELLEELLPKKSAVVLDIGCGTGKYIGHLSKEHKAIGIDPDESSIQLARKQYPGTEYFVDDFFSFETGLKFDLIFSIGNVVSHIPTDDLDKFIQKMKALLKPGGVWMFHTMNWDLILERNNFTFPVIEKDGLKFERKYENLSAKGVDFVTKLTDPSNCIADQCIRLYPQLETHLMELHQGFRLIGLYTNYAKTPVSKESNSKVFIFKKK